MPGTLRDVRKAPHRKTMGLELECFFPRDAAVEYEKFYGFFFAGYDGSIHAPRGCQGWEFVSQPLTQDWLKKEIKKLSKKFQWETNDSCGIHVHINREWCSEQRGGAINKFIKSLSREDRIELFGRDFNKYCSENGNRYSRYRPVNLTNKNTIEIRMFNSGDECWAQWCVDFSVYLVENAKRLNVEAALAYRLWWLANN